MGIPLYNAPVYGRECIQFHTWVVMALTVAPCSLWCLASSNISFCQSKWLEHKHVQWFSLGLFSPAMLCPWAILLSHSFPASIFISLSSAPAATHWWSSADFSVRSSLTPGDSLVWFQLFISSELSHKGGLNKPLEALQFYLGLLRRRWLLRKHFWNSQSVFLLVIHQHAFPCKTPYIFGSYS